VGPAFSPAGQTFQPSPGRRNARASVGRSEKAKHVLEEILEKFAADFDAAVSLAGAKLLLKEYIRRGGIF